jgi:hypothetical protein
LSSSPPRNRGKITEAATSRFTTVAPEAGFGCLGDHRGAGGILPLAAGDPMIAHSLLSGLTMGNRLAIAAIVAVLAAPGMWGTASAAPQAGEVLALFGPCFVVVEVQKTPLKRGDAVHVGDTVDVEAGAKLRLRMNDGSVISIGSGGRLTILAYRVGEESRDATLSLAAGLLRAVVSRFRGPSHFEVRTATGVAAVRSTDWFIEAKPGATQVGVLEGRVSLRSVATGKEILIPAHWGARVEAGRDPVPARAWTEAEFDDFIARTGLE